MKKKVVIIISIILFALVIVGFVASRKDGAYVRNGLEPRFVIKTISNHGDKVTYWGLGYKVVRYVNVSPNEPYENNKGVKFGSWFMNYELEDDKKGHNGILEDHGDVLLNIEKPNHNCVPISLALYDDNQYELFTDYAECKPGTTCTDVLRYTKSIKGTYDFDVERIIKSAKNANDMTFNNDNIPEYDLYLGDKFIKKYDSLEFVIEKGKTSKEIDELLKQLNIDLNKCAKADYVK